MDWLLVFILFGLFVLGYLVALLSTSTTTQGLKRENEVLNEKLRKLTDRDERGRFKK